MYSVTLLNKGISLQQQAPGPQVSVRAFSPEGFLSKSSPKISKFSFDEKILPGQLDTEGS